MVVAESGVLAARISPMLDCKGKERRNLSPANFPESVMRRWSYVLICVLVGVALGGCPKNNGHADYKAGEKAFDLKDYDAAVDYYSKALDGRPAQRVLSD